MIDFNELKLQEVEHFKNGEGICRMKMVDDKKVKIIKSVIEKGVSSGEHIHENSAEIIYVLSGRGHFFLDGKEEVLVEGQVHYCPLGHSHHFKNEDEEPLILLCVVPQF